MADQVEFKSSLKSPTYWLSVAAFILGAIVSSGILEAYPNHWAVKVVALLVSLLGALGYVVPNMALKQSQVKASAITTLGENAPNPTK